MSFLVPREKHGHQCKLCPGLLLGCMTVWFILILFHGVILNFLGGGNASPLSAAASISIRAAVCVLSS